MRTVIAALLVVLVGVCGARATPNDACPVPGYLLFGDSLLERVIAAVNQGRALKIVVLGTTSSTLSGSESARDAYPARLEDVLRRMLPNVKVEVVSYAKPRQTAEKMIKTFDKMLLDEKPILVIWQTGTFDAIQGIDPKEFLTSITEGVEKLQSRGVDIILVNMQYSPRMELMLAIEAYAENMRWVARERQVPLFDRLAIMRTWNDTGAIDLYAATKDVTTGKRLHDCIGRALASLVIDAGRLNALEGKTPR
jgi:hypothetical protein